ncbi:MAG: YraN family protein [Acidimicrobiia bacterium]|nr:YraN family protein [Acidimicrobiia bacterium]
MFLERHGLSIIDRNVRVGRGEVDLVADDGGRRVVVEVKTVLAVGFAPPTAEDAFTADKERTVRRLASKLHPPASRVDLIAISLMESGVRLRWLKCVA